MINGKHPGGRPVTKNRVKRTYMVDRAVAEYIDNFPDGDRSNFVSDALKVAKERQEAIDKDLKQIAHSALVQAQSEGLEDADAKWMAVGAVNREAREQGVIGEELDDAMNAASQAVVRQVQEER